MKTSPRERLLVSVLVTLALAAGFYFFVYTGKQDEIRRLSAQLTQKQQQVAEMEQLAAQREDLEREYRALQDRIRAIEAKLPPAREIPTLLRQMQAVASEVGVKMNLIRPGALEAPTGQAGAGPRQGQPPAAAPAPASGQGQQAQPAAPPYQQFRLELSFEGTYDTLLSMLRRLENFPRFIAMTQLAISPQQPLPRLRLNVVSNTFVLPEARP